MDITAATGPSVSLCVLDADNGTVLASADAGRVRPTASVGKLVLLIEVARRLAGGELDRSAALPRTPTDTVADSGLWQHLSIPALPAADLAALVGAVSDNLATNVLLREVGLPAVTAIAVELGLTATRLLDRVRDVRGPADPATLSTGSAIELAGLFAGLHGLAVVNPEVSAMVLGWLNLDTDMSMVAGAFGLDPLAHTATDRGWWLAHKTGTDTGIRADVGLVRGPGRAVGYAVLVEFDDDDRDEAFAVMRHWGEKIRTFASQ